MMGGFWMREVGGVGVGGEVRVNPYVWLGGGWVRDTEVLMDEVGNSLWFC